jgi:hypothetical protein
MVWRRWERDSWWIGAMQRFLVLGAHNIVEEGEI